MGDGSQDGWFCYPLVSMLPWSRDQRSRVKDAIGTNPVESGRCAELAWQIRPEALALDPHAQSIVIRPVRQTMRYVAAKHPAGARGFTMSRPTCSSIASMQ